MTMRSSYIWSAHDIGAYYEMRGISGPFAAVCLLLCFLVPGPVKSQDLGVSAVVDGERLVLSDGSRVHLLGVAAPERFSTLEMFKDMLRGSWDEQAIREQSVISAAYLTSLVRGRSLHINYQDTHTGGADVGPAIYRPAYIYVKADEKGGGFVLNMRMIEDGYAFVDWVGLQADAVQRDVFMELQVQAMQHQVGFWARRRVFVDRRNRGPDDRFDPLAPCESNQGCLWISGEDMLLGAWISAPGYTCPCAGK